MDSSSEINPLFIQKMWHPYVSTRIYMLLFLTFSLLKYSWWCWSSKYWFFPEFTQSLIQKYWRWKKSPKLLRTVGPSITKLFRSNTFLQKKNRKKNISAFPDLSMFCSLNSSILTIKIKDVKICGKNAYLKTGKIKFIN